MEEQKEGYTFEVEDTNGRVYILKAPGPMTKISDLVEALGSDHRKTGTAFSGPAFWTSASHGMRLSDEVLELAAAGQTVDALGRRYTTAQEIPHIASPWDPELCRFTREEYRGPKAVRWKI